MKHSQAMISYKLFSYFEALEPTRKSFFADKNEAALMKKCEVICKRCQDMHDKE